MKEIPAVSVQCGSIFLLKELRKKNRSTPNKVNACALR
jgi:hypothetical protein